MCRAIRKNKKTGEIHPSPTLKTFKNMSISLVTWVVDIAQKSYSTLQKALDIGNLSLENMCPMSQEFVQMSQQFVLGS